MFDEFEQFQRFKTAWTSVRVERAVEYSLFTFGDSELPYFLITTGNGTGNGATPRENRENTVRIRKGQVTISRARIITPDSMTPELRDFFEGQEETALMEFLMARTAAFSNLKLSNQSGPDRIVTDTVEEAVARLNHQLDAEDEDRVAILSAPSSLAGFAVFRYATEKVMSSAPGNIRELRERGLLP